MKIYWKYKLTNHQSQFICNRYVLIGNHGDAWTFGAVDPNSGTAALLEVYSIDTQLSVNFPNM
jgi:hypothetical protein